MALAALPERPVEFDRQRRALDGSLPPSSAQPTRRTAGQIQILPAGRQRTCRLLAAAHRPPLRQIGKTLRRIWLPQFHPAQPIAEFGRFPDRWDTQHPLPTRIPSRMQRNLVIFNNELHFIQLRNCTFYYTTIVQFQTIKDSILI